ncbi:very short patch repair endonuclease [Sulfuricaulis limicola]|uniref:very short patch repair endonuclease n=1 Tax=Sulfuricaulis limicola TaxID=1620215 RepID=UPI000BBB2A00|nr:very short patch repair endonuclease [Sulfuricaulis limicola]
MTDIVDRATRSRMMSGIRSKNTKPELLIRKGLFSKGYRYRLHGTKLPGKPDLVFPKYKAVVFVHGCFWHGHNCRIFKWPSKRAGFWKKKILGNKRRDHKQVTALVSQGWRVLVIWECAIKGPGRRDLSYVVERSASWLRSRRKSAAIEGSINPKHKKKYY